MLFILAAALELFVDWAPIQAPADPFFPPTMRTQLKEKGWDLVPFEQKPENTWVFWNLGERVKDVDWASHPKDKLVLFMWEPPTVQPELHDPKVQDRFGKIFTWNDDLVDNKRFFKFNYPVLRPKITDLPPFEEKKFCTMIAGRLCSKHPKQLYQERENTIRFFEEKPGKFDLYGKYWEKRKYKNWKGPIPDKLAVLKNYKFSICYENMRDIKGYITEKIFDCFAAGVVPVYWGASNVADYIPPGCFIDRRQFKDNRALYKFLKKITREEYAAYLECAERFLNSEQARSFSEAHLAKTFMTIID